MDTTLRPNNNPCLPSGNDGFILSVVVTTGCLIASYDVMAHMVYLLVAILVVFFRGYVYVSAGVDQYAALLSHVLVTVRNWSRLRLYSIGTVHKGEYDEWWTIGELHWFYLIACWYLSLATITAVGVPTRACHP